MVLVGVGATQNIRGNLPANQSPLNPAAVGAVNISARTSGVSPGVTADYGASVGGNRNTVAGNAASNFGGTDNEVAGSGSGNVGGVNKNLNGNLSGAVGGSTITLDGTASFGAGGRFYTLRQSSQIGNADGFFTVAADAQQVLSYLTRGESVNAAPVQMVDQEGQQLSFPDGFSASISLIIHAKAIAPDTMTARFWRIVTVKVASGLLVVDDSSNVVPDYTSGPNILISSNGSNGLSIEFSGVPGQTWRALARHSFMEIGGGVL